MIAIPAYLRQLGYLDIHPSWDHIFNTASKVLLYASGIVGAAIILLYVFQAWFKRRKVQASLVAATKVSTSS